MSANATKTIFQLDTEQGTLKERSGRRMVAIPPAHLVAVLGRDLGLCRILGSELGLGAKAELVEHFGAQLGSPDDAFTNAATYLSACGWGRLELERWGATLTAKLSNGLLGDDATAAFLSGFFSALSEREAECVAVGSGRVLLANRETARTLNAHLRSGESFPAVLARLNLD